MNLNKNKILTFISIIAVFSWSLQSSIAVICTGIDGHFSIESSMNGLCEGSERSHTGHNDEHNVLKVRLTSCESHCGDCLDTPINFVADISSVRTIGNQFVPRIHTESYNTFNFKKLPVNENRFSSTIEFPGHHSFWKTIVLLI